VSLCVSCDYFQSKQQNDLILAEVEGKILRLSEVKNIFIPGMKPEDSLELLRNYVYNWTGRCIMAAKAAQALDKQQLDVTKELDDYRMSLLAYRYEMFRLQQELDTLVTNDELLSYYDQGSTNLSASLSPRARVVYAKVRPTAEKLNELRIALSDNKDRQFLDSLCMLMAVQPDYMDNRWLIVDEIPDILPFTREQCNFAIRNNAYMLEERKGGYVHLLGLREINRKPDYPPITQLKEQFYSTIMNRRRMELLKKIQNDAYNDALDNQRLKIYINE
jgi:hypothetical protein